MGHVKILKKELELISDQYGHFGERLGRIKLILTSLCTVEGARIDLRQVQAL